MSYLPIKTILEIFPLSDYMIRKLLKEGCVRYSLAYQQGQSVAGPRRHRIFLLWSDDIEDYLNKVPLTWISVGKAALTYNVTYNAAKYWYKQGIVRSKKDLYRMVCKEDCDCFVSNSNALQRQHAFEAGKERTVTEITGDAYKNFTPYEIT